MVSFFITLGNNQYNTEFDSERVYSDICYVPKDLATNMVLTTGISMVYSLILGVQPLQEFFKDHFLH